MNKTSTTHLHEIRWLRLVDKDTALTLKWLRDEKLIKQYRLSATVEC